MARAKELKDKLKEHVDKQQKKKKLDDEKSPIADQIKKNLMNSMNKTDDKVKGKVKKSKPKVTKLTPKSKDDKNKKDIENTIKGKLKAVGKKTSSTKTGKDSKTNKAN